MKILIKNKTLNNKIIKTRRFIKKDYIDCVFNGCTFISTGKGRLITMNHCQINDCKFKGNPYLYNMDNSKLVPTGKTNLYYIFPKEEQGE